MRPSTRRAKRSLDVVLATVGLLLGLPLLPLVALAIKLTSHGPVFHRTVRVGVQRRGDGSHPRGGSRVADGRGRYIHRTRFRVLAEREQRLASTGEDPRLTRVGRLLRRTGLEDWPQLFAVLVGRMSLVGPRPVTPAYLDRLDRAGQLARVPRGSVPPGVCGLSQLARESDESFHAGLCGHLVFDRIYLRRLQECSPLHAVLLDLTLLVECLLRRLRPGEPGGRDAIRVGSPRVFRQVDLDARAFAEARPERMGSEVVAEEEGFTAWWYPPRRRPLALPALGADWTVALGESVRPRGQEELVLTHDLLPSGRAGRDEITVELPRDLHPLSAVCAHLEPLWTALAPRASDEHFATTMAVRLVESLAAVARPGARGAGARASVLRVVVSLEAEELRLHFGQVGDAAEPVPVEAAARAVMPALPA